MKRLKEFINPSLSQQKIDETMETLLNDKFHKDSKKRYEAILAEKYQVQRDGNMTGIKEKPLVAETQNTSFTKWFILIAVLGALVAGYLFLNNQNSSPINTEEQIFEYMASNDVDSYNNSRSTQTETDQIRLEAVEAFQNKDYKLSAEKYGLISTPTKEDLYFGGMSYLHLKDYSKAIFLFDSCLEGLNENDKYHPEASLYRILAWELNGQKDKAKAAFEAQKEGSWIKRELNKVLKY